MFSRISTVLPIFNKFAVLRIFDILLFNSYDLYLSGENYAAFALTEPASGSDAGSIKVRRCLRDRHTFAPQIYLSTIIGTPCKTGRIQALSGKRLK